ncbi:MAG: phosphoribosylformylglycinamidine cyclo-ligase, partial [Myxococcota bacterium]
SGCEQAGAALLGGETAEMPGMYSEGKYDLAGFCVGMVDRPRIIDGTTIAIGDAIIGLASSGLHSNGYSLVRHVLFEREGLALDSTPEGLSRPLIDELLEPTRIYAKATLAATRNHTVHGMAHITGGGLEGNVARVVPDGLVAHFDAGSWVEPDIFGLMRRLGTPDAEMALTFNRGLGMVIVCPEAEADALLQTLSEVGETCTRVGTIQGV